MAEQLFTAKCGFFDAVNGDRVYTAEEMNLPYARIVADGVFATNLGTPSNDFKVSAAGGMSVVVSAGQAIVAHKWFKLETSQTVTVDSNASVYKRIDSIILQVNNNAGNRDGSVVYRPGTAAAIATPPALSGDPNVTEYRVANIEVAAGATVINQSKITDLRGSSACPWVTGLIKQVDTSTLWAQYQQSYADQYEQYDTDYAAYVTAQRQAWEDFLASLTDDLTVATNVVTLNSAYTVAADNTTHIPINIASYDASTDVLMVFINGLMAEGKYSVDVPGYDYITLTNGVPEGTLITFVCFKSLVEGDISSTISAIQTLDAKVDGFMQDSGWVNLTLASGVTAVSGVAPAYRKVGDRVYLRGALAAGVSTGTAFAALPVNAAPAKAHMFTVVGFAESNNEYKCTALVTVNPAGELQAQTISGTLDGCDYLPMDACWVVG